MSKSRPLTGDSVSKNLKRLMTWKGWKQPQLAAASGVSQTHIGAILRGEAACTIPMADLLAKPFGLRGWHLLIPNLPDDLVTSPSLQRLVDAYIGATHDGRNFLDAAAERELKRLK